MYIKIGSMERENEIGDITQNKNKKYKQRCGNSPYAIITTIT